MTSFSCVCYNNGMKSDILLGLFFTLLKQRKTSAKELALRFEISERTVYRYLDELTVAGIPIDLTRGRYGGVRIADTFRLPMNFMTREEYDAASEALAAMYAQIPDEKFRRALEKIRSQVKREKQDLTVSGNILIDASSWGDAYRFTDKLQVVEEAVNRGECLHIGYISSKGEVTERVIEPLVLVFKQNIWYVHAYCRRAKANRLFRIGRIRKASFTGETFPKRSVPREEISLKFWHDTESLLSLKLAFDKAAVPDLEEWLGVDCVNEETGIAEATLPDSPVLTAKLLGFGEHVKVLAPESVIQKLKETYEKIKTLYS